MPLVPRARGLEMGQPEPQGTRDGPANPMRDRAHANLALGLAGGHEQPLAGEKKLSCPGNVATLGPGKEDVHPHRVHHEATLERYTPQTED